VFGLKTIQLPLKNEGMRVEVNMLVMMNVSDRNGHERPHIGMRRLYILDPLVSEMRWLHADK
jgi:hypothetical protein